MTNSKTVEELLPADFECWPVWQFTLNRETESDLLVEPVKSLPVDTLNNRLAGTHIRLANGSLMMAMLGNIDLIDPRKTRHFLTLSLFDGRAWRHLARYHDPDFPTAGPEAFAAAFRLSRSEMFPITYDLRQCCVGNPLCTTGEIQASPEEKLTPGEISALALD